MGMSRKAKRELAWILVLLAAFSFAFYMVVGDSGVFRLRQYQAEAASLQAQQEELKKTQTQLLSQIDRVKNDPQELERIARERHQLARPGDVIVTVPSKSSASGN